MDLWIAGLAPKIALIQAALTWNIDRTSIIELFHLVVTETPASRSPDIVLKL